MIQVTIRMTFEAHKKDHAVRELLAIMGHTRTEDGCMSCSVRSDAEHARVVVYEELWRGEEDLARHQHLETYRAVLAVSETASAPPDIKIDTITSSSGMELIEKARMRDKEEMQHGNII